jgi:hypothetical protein
MFKLKLFWSDFIRLFRNLLPDNLKGLEPEVVQAYWHKLPNSIEVKWFRDGHFIVGEVEAGGYKFMTQGRNAKEFIEMVNDALLAVYEVPDDYLDLFLKIKANYQPDSYQMSLLTDKTVHRADFGIKKMKLAYN